MNTTTDTTTGCSSCGSGTMSAWWNNMTGINKALLIIAGAFVVYYGYKKIVKK